MNSNLVGTRESLPHQSAIDRCRVGKTTPNKRWPRAAIAVALGFNAEGGSRNFRFATRESHSELHAYLRPVRGVVRPRDGYFLRAESFLHVATEIEQLDSIPASAPPVAASYGPRAMHEQSHGELFLALIEHRFHGGGLYLLDEPEAALSPMRQMALLSMLHDLVRVRSQFVIATHSSILLAYPRATIYEIGPSGVTPTAYEATDHLRITHDFLNRYPAMLRSLLSDKGAPE